MKVFVIYPTKNCDSEMKKRIKVAIKRLEDSDMKVYTSIANIAQDGGCCWDTYSTVLSTMADVDVVCVAWNDKNQNVLFELGIAFALKKPIVLLPECFSASNKSLINMIKHWAKYSECEAIDGVNIALTNIELAKELYSTVIDMKKRIRHLLQETSNK